MGFNKSLAVPLTPLLVWCVWEWRRAWLAWKPFAETESSVGETALSGDRGDGVALFAVRWEKNGSKCKRGPSSIVDFREGPGEWSSWK